MAFYQGLCGTRWNRTTDLSIISARQRDRRELLGTAWYSVRTEGIGTNWDERPGIARWTRDGSSERRAP